MTPEEEPENPICDHSTRRNLPHWRAEGCIYWITFRMADSLPQQKLQRWTQEHDDWLSHHPKPWKEADWREYEERFGRRLQDWLDNGYGSCVLADPEIRQIVEDCLLRFHGKRFWLHAAAIMPNHVHLLLEPLPENELRSLLKGIKGTSAHRANLKLGRTGTFWLDESYDHIVRSEEQYQYLLRYIAGNPIRAGLHPGEYSLYGDTGIPACEDKL